MIILKLKRKTVINYNFPFLPNASLELTREKLASPVFSPYPRFQKACLFFPPIAKTLFIMTPLNFGSPVFFDRKKNGGISGELLITWSGFIIYKFVYNWPLYMFTSYPLLPLTDMETVVLQGGSWHSYFIYNIVRSV